MLDQFEMGTPASRIDELFAQVQSFLVPFIAQIHEVNASSLEALKGKFNFWMLLAQGTTITPTQISRTVLFDTSIHFNLGIMILQVFPLLWWEGPILIAL